MAKRRMFSLEIVDTDAFLDMPISARLLYYDLGMRADDDGFVANPRRITKLIGASEDDLKILMAKRYVLTFESGVMVIKHWRMNNYIQKDRYEETRYKEEAQRLFIKENGAYTFDDTQAKKPLIKARIQNVYTMDTQVSIGKDRLDKVRIDNKEDKLDKYDKALNKSSEYGNLNPFTNEIIKKGYIDTIDLDIPNYNQFFKSLQTKYDNETILKVLRYCLDQIELQEIEVDNNFAYLKKSMEFNLEKQSKGGIENLW